MDEWNCNNKCKNNCCSEIFLPLTPSQKITFDLNKWWTVRPDQYDLKWLKFHDKGIFIDKLDDGRRKITLLTDDYKMLLHPMTGIQYLWIKTRCKMLLQNNKCKVYRNRPITCRRADCMLYSPNKKERWFGENSTMNHLMNERP